MPAVTRRWDKAILARGKLEKEALWDPKQMWEEREGRLQWVSVKDMNETER